MHSKFGVEIVDALANSAQDNAPSRLALRMLIRDRICAEIPPGFKTITDTQGRRIVVRDKLEKSLRIEIFLDANDGGKLSRFYGRGSIRSVRIGGNENALIRCYYHGGLLRSVTGRIFFTWPPRPFRELAITERIRRQGVPTVEVCAACVEPIWGPLYKGWLATKELAGARDLWTALSGNFVREAGIDNIWRAVASSLRLLHREGVYHKDLNLKNILVRRESDTIKAYIIDFDKATLFFGPVPARIARKNLDRLFRSLRKLDPEQNYVSEGDWNRFVECYNGAAV